MKKVLLILFLLFAFVNVAQAVPDAIGINFRNTSGFVTDGTNETYCRAADAYPITRDGYTFGITTPFTASADRSAVVDRRLAGIITGANEDLETFQLDLKSTGSKVICLAVGDLTNDQNNCKIEVFDNASSLIVISHANCALATYYDASDVNRSAALWPANQVCVTKTFATTTLKVVMGTGSANGGTAIAHISVTDASSSVSSVSVLNAMGEL